MQWFETNTTTQLQGNDIVRKCWRAVGSDGGDSHSRVWATYSLPRQAYPWHLHRCTCIRNEIQCSQWGSTVPSTNYSAGLEYYLWFIHHARFVHSDESIHNNSLSFFDDSDCQCTSSRSEYLGPLPRRNNSAFVTTSPANSNRKEPCRRGSRVRMPHPTMALTKYTYMRDCNKCMRNFNCSNAVCT